MRPSVLLSCLLLSTAASAQNLVMNHSGYLLDANDQPVSNASLPMVFRLYNVRDLHGTGENLVWESRSCNVDVSRGFYNVSLGESCNGTVPLQATHIPPNETRFLEVEVNGVPLAPRLLLGSVPNAVVAATALEAKALKIAPGAGAGLVLLSDATGSGAWGQVGSAGIADGSLVDADIANSAAIATTKLSGPVTAIANNGLGSLATKSAITDAEIPADAAVSTSKLAGPVTAIPDNGLGALALKNAIADADIASGAAIATSKLSGPISAIANNGLGTLAAKSAIANADVAGNAAIATSKLAGPLTAVAGNGLGALATKSSIVDGDVAADASIAGTKISPDFGSQNVYTSGKVGVGTTSPAAKLDVNGDLRVAGNIHGPVNGGYRILSTDWQNISNMSCGSNPTGYMKLVTPIVVNEGNMFSIHITFYGYGGGGAAGDIRCGGYAYAAGTLQNQGCSATGISLPYTITSETRGGKNVVVIKIGSPTQNWYFQHFSYDYVGWQAHTPSEFQWVCGEAN